MSFPFLDARLGTLMLGVAMALPCAGAAPHAEHYGRAADGTPVGQVTLENRLGMRLKLIDYGATLTAVEVPDRHGRRANIVLGLPDLPAYLGSKRRFGTVGRFAGKIVGNRYTLDGQEVDLGASGAPGFERRIWQRRDFNGAESSGAIFTLVSPAGDQGFPGALTVSVTYRLLHERNEFRIEYLASSDAPTVLNLTNHSYFNLTGAGTEGLRGHRLQIDADRHVALRDKLPTGDLPSVAGTSLDFRAGRSLYGEDGQAIVYDANLVFAKPAGSDARVAVIDEQSSGRRMEVWTTTPSVQLFTGTSFDGREIGAEGRAYRPHDGVAFEPQHLSGSPNYPHFPTTALYPGQQFKAVSSFRFSVAGARRSAD